MKGWTSVYKLTRNKVNSDLNVLGRTLRERDARNYQ